MPFKSDKQKAYLKRNKPKLYREFAAKEKAAGGHKAYIRMSKTQKRNLSRGYK